jgi:hypothetical protein
MAQDLIPLAEAIGALRKELSDAMAAGHGEALQFEVGPVELELNLVVQREAAADGKLKFKIFGWGAEAGVSGKLADERSHKVKLVLTPVLDGQAEGVVVKVGDKESAPGADADSG